MSIVKNYNNKTHPMNYEIHINR